MKFFIYIIIGCMVICGCASQDDIIVLNDKIVMLEQQNIDLKRQIDSATRDKDQLKSFLDTYSKSSEEKGDKLITQSADLYIRLENIGEEIQMVKGKIEETDYSLKQRIKETEARIQKVEQYLILDKPVHDSRVTGPQVLPPPDKDIDVPEEPAIKTEGKKPEPSVTNALSDEELYTKGKAAFDSNDYESAYQNFDILLKKYPNSRIAANAQFWIGEIYYQQKQYEKAILAYQTVIEKYPSGNKTKDALYKQGLSFFHLGDRASARDVFQYLVDKYPDSEHARRARQKLDGF